MVGGDRICIHGIFCLFVCLFVPQKLAGDWELLLTPPKIALLQGSLIPLRSEIIMGEKDGALALVQFLSDQKCSGDGC
jgi:hypothetical protein